MKKETSPEISAIKFKIPAPTTLGEALELAINDLKKLAQSRYYQVDMGVWHKPIKGKCHVCLAGAIVSRNSNSTYKKEIHLAHVDEDWLDIMIKLDDLREFAPPVSGLSASKNYNSDEAGDIFLRIEREHDYPTYEVEEQRQTWYKAMYEVIKELKARGW